MYHFSNSSLSLRDPAALNADTKSWFSIVSGSSGLPNDVPKNIIGIMYDRFECPVSFVFYSQHKSRARMATKWLKKN